MSDVSATDAARRFSDLLDAVEHKGSSFTILRRGKAIAQIQPVPAGRGALVKEVLRGSGPDSEWADDLAATRSQAPVQDR